MLTLVIAGRPNVGKSTLFNRLAGKKLALVAPEPGVTRDWQEAECELNGVSFRLIDTAGWDVGHDPGSVAARARLQTERALALADAALFVVDARAGLTAEDRDAAKRLRREGLPVILLANKCDSGFVPGTFDELYELGMDEAIPVSAEHGDGLADLSRTIAALSPQPEEEFSETDEVSDEAAVADLPPLRLAIVGRPNVGKSTLVNALLGQERVLTGPEPGLTRDTIAVTMDWHGHSVRLVDTAGLRRSARVTEDLEHDAVHESMRAIRLAEVVVLLLDATEPSQHQDMDIAARVETEGRVLVIVANKWDKVKDPDATMRALRDRLGRSLGQLPDVPVVTLSALRGEGLGQLMSTVAATWRRWNSRASTGSLNRWLAEATEAQPAPMVAGRRIKIRYITQIKARPPTFVLWMNKPLDLPQSYMRYLARSLGRRFDLAGIPLRWLKRKGDNPYATKTGCDGPRAKRRPRSSNKR
ncbi:MAG: ribosome biogenesis GTPase Der [Alphaproteobacteria bacterium]|nr:MAG: ribosome biogenesis GTPase Der [Alphaproteobacteria bacterium]